jgi:DNA-binding LacI/PurR family transcriptional regulator
VSEASHVRTLSELAALAGVSTGTASRALSDSPLISAETRERIQALAREHSYHPNLTARNLRTRRTGAIAVLIPLGHAVGQPISDPFFIAMLGHLADELSGRGYDLLLRRVIPKGPDWLSDVTDSGRVDGVILIGQSDQVAVIDEIAGRYQPLVVWGAIEPGHCTVGGDNWLGGVLAARHLLDRGARRFAFIGDYTAPEFALRLEGARSALETAEAHYPLALVPTGLEAESAHATIRAWLQSEEAACDGVFCASDVIALSAIRALNECGHHVPDTVRVVGYDDIPLAIRATPPLTTIRQDIALGAKRLVELLFKRMGGEDTLSVVLSPELVVREST